MVGQWTLDPLILVRIQAPEQIKSLWLGNLFIANQAIF